MNWSPGLLRREIVQGVQRPRLKRAWDCLRPEKQNPTAENVQMFACLTEGPVSPAVACRCRRKPASPGKTDAARYTKGNALHIQRREGGRGRKLATRRPPKTDVPRNIEQNLPQKIVPQAEPEHRNIVQQRCSNTCPPQNRNQSQVAGKRRVIGF